MLDSIYHMTLKLLENVKILPSFKQHYNGRHYIMLQNLFKPLSILLHGVISLPDVTSGDNKLYHMISLLFNR